MLKDLVARYWNYVINVGVTQGMSFIEARRTKLLNLLALPCIPFMLGYAILNACQHRYLLGALNFTTTLMCVGVLLMHKYQLYKGARLVMIFFSVVIYTFMGLFFHNGAQYFLLNVLIFCLLVYDNNWIMTTLGVLILAAFLWVLFWPLHWTLADPVPQERVWSNVAVSLLFIIISLRVFKQIQYDYQAEVEEQRQVLSAMNKDKEKLFSIVAHDIRSPLATLEILLDMYRRGEYPEEEMQAATDALYLRVAELGVSVDNVLRWSSRNIRGIRWRPEAFALGPQVQEVLSFCQLLIQQKQVTIDLDIRDDICLYADRDQVSVILRNICINALKFSHSGDKVAVAAHRHGDTVSIIVKDNGVGMSEEQLNKLFSGNPGGNTSGTRGEWGTGLGMLLCVEFAQQNKGDIVVKSAPGEGTMFTVVLPAADEEEI
ncbi:sensor histidine kinase [Chitinophaga vietnamensis]|uniref:sensor histidine kinase n=1 Tax=Chitinophaga vietnamensis TaxID=2593957 RepID=UPI0011784B42|nr:HAMP domain-containing sensor histidine kinase [Chitinophaga vietnamensis]